MNAVDLLVERRDRDARADAERRRRRGRRRPSCRSTRSCASSARLRPGVDVGVAADERARAARDGLRPMVPRRRRAAPVRVVGVAPLKRSGCPRRRSRMSPLLAVEAAGWPSGSLPGLAISPSAEEARCAAIWLSTSVLVDWSPAAVVLAGQRVRGSSSAVVVAVERVGGDEVAAERVDRDGGAEADDAAAGADRVGLDRRGRRARRRRCRGARGRRCRR